jgi:hypothetical protein
MATTKVSALAAKTSLAGSEELLINDSGTSKKVTATNLLAGVTDATKLPLAGGTMTGNIVMSGSETVDGRDLSADGTKLDGIEANATADQSNAEIKTAYEANSDTNAFTDADHSKLDGIEASADVTDTANVTAAGALMDSEVTNLAQVKAFDSSDYATAAQGTIADAALPKTGGAMTGAITTNSTFDGRDVATDGAKLDGIEASADVTDATNVAAAGALMKSGGTMTGSAQGSTDTDATNTGTVTLDFSTNQNFVLTLTGNVTLANPTTETVGQSGFITFIQDGTGSRTVGLGTDYETAGGAGLTLSSTASATDIVPYVVVASGRILLGTPQLAFA